MEHNTDRPETTMTSGQEDRAEPEHKDARERATDGKRLQAPRRGGILSKRQTQTGQSGRLRRKLSRRELLILLIPTLAAAAAVALVFRLADRGVRYQFSENGHQYYAGASNVVTKGQNLFCGSDGIVRAGDDGKGEPVRVPVYLDESPTVVLPMDMVYYDPRNSNYGRVISLSEVSCDKDGNISITHDGKTIQPRRGFLFDGNNFYLFLEAMEISFNGYKIEVPALSYVEAVFGGDIMVFDYGSKEFMIERCDGTGSAQVPSGDYVISLLGDSMMFREGQKALLVSRPDVLDPIG